MREEGERGRGGGGRGWEAGQGAGGGDEDGKVTCDCSQRKQQLSFDSRASEDEEAHEISEAKEESPSASPSYVSRKSLPQAAECCAQVLKELLLLINGETSQRVRSRASLSAQILAMDILDSLFRKHPSVFMRWERRRRRRSG